MDMQEYLNLMHRNTAIIWHDDATISSRVSVNKQNGVQSVFQNDVLEFSKLSIQIFFFSSLSFLKNVPPIK